MKKFSVFFLITLAVACSKKSLPVIERRTEVPPAPVVEVNILAGEKLFTNRCGRCHDLPETTKYNFENWQPVLSTMLPRAGLNGTDAAHVRAYIKANAAKQ